MSLAHLSNRWLESHENGDEWGMVQIALLYQHYGRLSSGDEGGIRTSSGAEEVRTEFPNRLIYFFL